jgi:two-component system, NarL family, invasion response regulator UvrY
MSPHKFLIVDDHVVVRSGLRLILEDEFPGAVFGEAATAASALGRVVQEPWDLVLLDVTLPGRSGLEALDDLRHARPRMPVLMLSMHPEAEFAVRALKSGAVGYLSKQSAAEELVGAVRKALAGGRYITAALAEKLAAAVAGDARARLPHEGLSNREFQTMRLLAAGRTVKEIAGELSLSAKTVSTYRTRILSKLGLRGTAELVRYAIEHKLG